MLKVFKQSVHCHIKNSLSSVIFSLDMSMVVDKGLCLVLPYKLLKQ